MTYEQIQREKKQDLHDQAVIMRASINSALAIAYGKDKGGFDAFLKTLVPDDGGGKQVAVVPTFAAHGIKATPKPEGGGMDEWEEMG